MTAPANGDRVPQWLLERIALGEAPVGADASGQGEELERLEQSNRDILAELPPRVVALEIERRAAMSKSRAGSRAPMWLAAAAAMATAIVLAVVLLRGDDGRRVATVDPAESDSGIRIKGDPRLLVHHKQGDSITQLISGATRPTGSLLQLSYIAAGRKHGVIVSVDGRGQATLHFPATVTSATHLALTAAIPLDHSYRLDDAPRFERFFFVTSATPLDPAAVVAAAERLAQSPRADRDPLPIVVPGVEQSSLIINKSETP